ncbi:3-phosphoshikimate 1-carboxyvinyltransferase [Sneathiella chungangensis]|uniref:3-phosphoshikimate 1-carboxyvinyltransferase n=1 Tax=Sneathiella chungangensis TaxID=1418234 RepID=A0A845MLP1_9PROT|nr:3-phosphoshikimate 1-carboxyvinyltransferase [Sneathiella chungangensis]MZR24110.1 3-phosphoshikimate 1-carboxyvinyltransferase [Sneathiella chungangensis]
MTTHSSVPLPVTARRTGPLAGTIKVPGDKSISHRSLIFGALAAGTTRITGLLEGEDVLRTAAAMRQLGAEVEKMEDGSWQVRGNGVGALAEPDTVLDMGNSGTAARLLMGLVASCPFTTFFMGDTSLHRRPMGRVRLPLEEMGALITSRSGGRFPLAVTGRDLMPIDYELPVASAQVKSAILLAALDTPGLTRVTEPKPTRDHTENMLRHFGATVTVTDLDGGGRRIDYQGQQELTAADIIVPGDPSSAAFIAVAAAILPGSDVTITNVGLNPLRDGIFVTLKEMGADIEIMNLREEAGERVGDLHVRASRLNGIEVPPERAPTMIDEFPVLFVAASFATGKTVMRGLHELRVKESDRIAAMAAGLKSCGVKFEELDDGLIIEGNGRAPKGGGKIETHLDHRIAMSFLVMGLAAEKPVTVDDGRVMETSFPGFADLMGGLGGQITADNHR